MKTTFQVLSERYQNLQQQRSQAAKNYVKAGKNKYDDPDGTIAAIDNEMTKVMAQMDEKIEA